MKKRYSDPLMFASRSILLTIPITNSQSGTITPDDDWDDENGDRSVFSINSAIEAPATQEPVTIVNPVEEAVEEASTSYTTESAGTSITESPVEVAPVIDEIVPEAAEEAATAATTMP